MHRQASQILEAAPRTIHTLELDRDGNPPFDGLVRLQQDTILRFLVPAGARVLAKSMARQKLPCLYTNYPSRGQPFIRQQFRPLSGYYLAGDGDWCCDMYIEVAGAFEYHMNILREDEERKVYQLGEGDALPIGRFVVDPAMHINGADVGTNGLVIQTVMPKCLGPLTTWMDVLQVSVETGYNMVHFTPVQQLGWSKSCYSLVSQLDLNDALFASPLPREEQWSSLKEVVDELEEAGLLSMCDVVWNHTAGNTGWLVDHPDAGFNLVNSPHLIPAFVLDEGIQRVSRAPYKFGLKPRITCSEDLDAVMHVLEHQVVPSLKMWEFFVVDVKATCEAFRKSGGFGLGGGGEGSVEMKAEQLVAKGGIYKRPEGGRYPWELDFAKAKLTVANAGELQSVLDVVNVSLYEECNSAVAAALGAVRGTMRWERLDANGPKLTEITHAAPLVGSYFTRRVPRGWEERMDRKEEHTDEFGISVEERISTGTLAECVFANNGWVTGLPPTFNFALPSSSAYLRRDIVIWSDSAKLRYGTSEKDSPWLWQHMKEYTERMASVFHAFRIDNCHSTPLHVARYCLDAARNVNPNLYVTAELFTNSRAEDEAFIQQLAINSLIREAIQPNDPNELARELRLYGGLVVAHPRNYHDVNPIQPRLARALFFDATHDNNAPSEKRTAQDCVSTAALTAMCDCSIGSVRGFDIMVPKKLDVASESRRYSAKDNGGILAIKATLNEIHKEMADMGYTEIHVHQQGNLLVVQRHHPDTKDAIVLLAHTAFDNEGPTRTSQSVNFPGTLSEVIMEAAVTRQHEYRHDPATITGIPVETTVRYRTSEWVEFGFNVLHVRDMPRGAIVLARMTHRNENAIRNALEKLEEVTVRLGSPENIDGELAAAMTKLNLLDLNVLLYRCDEEERDSLGEHAGVYTLPGGAKLEYAGLQGWMSQLNIVRSTRDMGSPLCNNLREGDWAMDYVVDRLRAYATLPSSRLDTEDMARGLHVHRFEDLCSWLSGRFSSVKQLPRYLIPLYFDAVIVHTYYAACQRAYALMSPFVQNAGRLTKRLALGSVQLMGVSKTAPPCARLPHSPTMAAGLPHFSTGYMRAWGRDTFIALRGLLLVTGRLAEARMLLLAFGEVVKHGLVPNLLAGGDGARYNARDATWFWLQALQDYTGFVDDDILTTAVEMRYHSDDQVEHTNKEKINYARPVKTVAEIVENILQKHAAGIAFREWNAGTKIDAHMKDNGFNISIRLDESSGLILGGNLDNCGTWMDKMGESDRAGTRGTPATPRDGADVEIIGLLASTLRWVAERQSDGTWPTCSKGVKLPSGGMWTYGEWHNKLVDNFERMFYVPEDPNDDQHYCVNSELVNRRGIYKDTVGGEREWADYQLRPNMCITMAVAPELFDKAHAACALRITREVLVGPLGIKTLDSSDWNYRPVYDQSLDNKDGSVSKGFNYHNGPEWLWPIGYFLRAEGQFSPRMTSVNLRGELSYRLFNHAAHIAESPWGGLPELTNKDGQACFFSCPSQAWSMSCLLDAIYDSTYDMSSEWLALPFVLLSAAGCPPSSWSTVTKAPSPMKNYAKH